MSGIRRAVKKSRTQSPDKPILPVPYKNNFMIIIHCDEVNEVSQEKYDRLIDQIDLIQLECPYCNHSGTTVHCYYDRLVKDKFGPFKLLVLRVRCRFCKKTHAILPETIVPYSSVTFEDTIFIVLSESSELNEDPLQKNLFLDYSDVYRIRRNFKRIWKDRLLSFDLLIDNQISQRCIEIFKRQFMQIHCTLCGEYRMNHFT